MRLRYQSSRFGCSDLLGNLYLLTFVRLVSTILRVQQFFGTIRIAAGSNDHPATPTFLQLYKLLSTYSIFKPPVSGNCTVTDEKPPPLLISVTDLKNIYKPERSSHVEEIRQKLDSIIEYKDWEVDEVIEHDYSVAPVLDCVIYFVTGLFFRYFYLNVEISSTFFIKTQTNPKD